MTKARKFRVWDKFQNKYIFEGFHVIGEVTVFGGINIEIHDTWKERSEKYKYESMIEAWDDFILEQFTGLEDSDNTNIYEGDILSGGFVVNFYNGAYGFWAKENSIPEFFMLYRCLGKKKVIGDIHNNPDLINQEYVR